jgi:carbamoyltransferase
VARQLFEYHPVFGYRFIPGLRARLDNDESGYLVRVNQAGFRSEREYKFGKRPGTHRVLLFGDSFTAGDGVSNRDRYGDLLEELVPGLEVYNFGLSSSGTDQQYLIFREFARNYDHDAIVIGVLVENIRRNVARYRNTLTGEGSVELLAKPYFILRQDGTLELGHSPVPKGAIDEAVLPPEERGHIDRGGTFPLLRTAINALGSRVKEQVQRMTHYQPLPAYDRPDNPAWLLTKAILGQWAKESRVPVLICPIPLYQYVEEMADPRPYQARFAELATLDKVVVHDPLPDFQRSSLVERRKYRFERNVHLTPMGHRVLAASLAPCIAEVLENTHE